MKLKHIILTVFSFACIGLSSCEETLDINPQQTIDANDAITTSQDLQGAVIGMYSILGGGELYGTNLLLLPELQGAEENIDWYGTFAGYQQVSGKSMTADNSEAQRTWLTAYEVINLSNIILSKLSLATNQNERDRIEGEALFVRGLMHFELVRLYAKAWNDGDPTANPGVPIRITPVTTEAEASATQSRSTVAQVYTQVITDLERARDLLPEFNDERATTFAASAFLTRVHLQKQDYGAALTEADRVISQGPYNLNPVVTQIFRNDNSAEAIFEIQQNDQNNAGTANDGLSTFYADLEGIGRGDVSIVAGLGTAILDQYEEDDTRLTDLIYIGYNYEGLSTGKWTSPGQNIPVIRLAEMYLTRAEANFRLGTTVGASPLEDVNRIRERAGASPLDILTLDDILRERRLELAFEGLRIHDLKRTETDLVGWAIDPDTELPVIAYTIPWDADELVFPIPRREIIASKNTLDQNPGYGG